VHQVKARAQAVLDQRRRPSVAIGAREAAGAFEDVGRAAEAALGEQRRGDAALRRVRRLDALAGRARVVELRNAAWVRAGEPNRFGDLLLVVLAREEQAARGGGGAERVAGAGALEAALEMARLHGEADANDSLVADDDGGDDLGPRSAGLLRDGECGGPDRDTRMQHRAHMRVVGVEARAER